MHNPGQDGAINRLLADGLNLYRHGRFDEAMSLYARLMVMAPDRVEPYLNAGQIAMIEGRYEDALVHFDKARSLKPDLSPAYEGAGDALLALGRPADALVVFEQLKQHQPTSSAAYHGAGEALKQLGQIQAARNSLERAVQIAPNVVGHHYLLAQLGRFVEKDQRLAGLERLKGNAFSLSDPERCELLFALGKAYDELGRPAQAFESWRAANAIKRRYVGYNEPMFLGILRALAAAFPAEEIKRRKGLGNPSSVPVFIVGMPRSGTSLVEQIVASHPDAFGAGELMTLHELLGQNFAGTAFPSRFGGVTAADLEKMGARYVELVRAQAPEAKRIVDKLPANFMLCGLIHCILPNAKIIHVQRDPLDTCFSCFANLFSQNIDYSYDLGELGRYYRAYDALMGHWRSVLPAGVMLDVSYEALVEDFEAQAARIIAHTGLEWNAACLDFHRTKRVVHTLSATQVREPVYRRAIGRAEPYAAWLEPLRRALSPS